ncbi:hypothetical protein [Salinisphaera sp. T31B1]|uniref:hypothetical protein n=1 Tax=Salinisphaera sp. T31B1 TaxID=727963 RepID=UPI00333FE49C
MLLFTVCAATLCLPTAAVAQQKAIQALDGPVNHHAASGTHVTDETTVSDERAAIQDLERRVNALERQQAAHEPASAARGSAVSNAIGHRPC